MKTAFILSGVPGAGKSTFIPRIKEINKLAATSDIATFSLDTCRLAFFDRQFREKEMNAAFYKAAFDNANENKVKFDAFVLSQWKRFLERDFVVVDNTNLTRKPRARWINDLRAKGFTIVGVQVNVPLQVALDRQATRGDKSVPLKIVEDMYMQQQEFLLGSEVDYVMYVDGVTGSVT